MDMQLGQESFATLGNKTRTASDIRGSDVT